MNFGFRRAVCALVPLVLAAASPAFAFEYDEHEAATRRALLALSLEPQVFEVAVALLESGGEEGLFCDDPLTPKNSCLVLSDVTGIAGDLTSSPGAMLFTHFSSANKRTSAPRDKSSMAKGGFYLVVGGRSPEQVAVGQSNAFGLAKIVRNLASAGPRQCRERFGQQTDTLDDYSGALYSLAANNHSHFEIAGDDELSPSIPTTLHAGLASNLFHVIPHEERDWYGVRESALAYYVELHAMARLLSDAADMGGERQLLYRAMALIEEMYALHFLQDLYAPGHRLRGASANAGFLRRARHQCLNRLGQPARARDAKQLCALATSHDQRLPLLADHCKNQPTSFGYMYGDAFLSCDGNAAASLTEEFLAGVSLLSLSEVFSREATLPSSGTVWVKMLTVATTEEFSDIKKSFVSSPANQRFFAYLNESWQTWRFGDGSVVEPKESYVSEMFTAGLFQALPPSLETAHMSSAEERCDAAIWPF